MQLGYKNQQTLLFTEQEKEQCMDLILLFSYLALKINNESVLFLRNLMNQEVNLSQKEPDLTRLLKKYLSYSLFNKAFIPIPLYGYSLGRIPAFKGKASRSHGY